MFEHTINTEIMADHNHHQYACGKKQGYCLILSSYTSLLYPNPPSEYIATTKDSWALGPKPSLLQLKIF